MTKSRHTTLISTIFIILISLMQTNILYSNEVTYVPTGNVFNKLGIYQPNGGKYQAHLIHGEGDTTLLLVKYNGTSISEEVIDITGAAWLTDSYLIYTVSPIYGKPGVYSFNCVTREIKRLVIPKTIDAASPDGADYFELYSLSVDKIYFYYSPDAGKTNFEEFRSKKYLFQCNLDGNQFKKSE